MSKTISKTEVLKLIGMNKINFPNCYKDLSEKQYDDLINLWYYNLKDFPMLLINDCFIQCLRTTKFPIVLADIFEKLKIIENAIEKTDDELWNIFVHGVWEIGQIKHRFHQRNGDLYMKQAENIFNNLPIEVRQFAGDLGQFAIYANMLDEELIQFIKPNFMKRIMALRARIKVIKETSPEILKLAANSLKTLDDEIKFLEEK